MHAVEKGYIEIIDMWEEGDGDQDVTFVKRKLEKAFTNQDEEWQKQRQLRLYHRSMDYVIADETELCKVGCYIHCADKMVRFVQFFHFFTSIDGLELAATALTSTKDCPTCECPRHLLGPTKRLYLFWNTHELRKAVEKASAELLNLDEFI